GLDTGPILIQERVAIDPAQTSGALHDRLASLGAQPLLRALEGLEKGTLCATAQPAEGVTYAAKIEKAEAAIDWSASAAQIERKVLAFNPWPVAETTFDGEQLRIHTARVADDGRPAAHAVAADPAAPVRAPVAAQPGTIIVVDNDSVIVACGEGAL